MIRPFILLGGKTDHGGMAITASGNISIGGKGIACVGDKVTRPKRDYGGTIVILTGDPNVIIDGKQAARHGDKTARGATLLSSQGNTGSIRTGTTWLQDSSGPG